MPFKDPAVRKARQVEYSKRYYQKNAEKHKARSSERKQVLRAWWYEYKSTLVCWSCGETSPECIDLHHVIASGKKDSRDIAANWATRQLKAPETVLRMIEETCVPLCANCHRKVHAEHKRTLREQQDTLKKGKNDAAL